MLSSPANKFPLSFLFYADGQPDFTRLERLGGTLTHLLSAYEEQRKNKFEAIKETITTPTTAFNFVLFNKAIILFNYVIVKANVIASKGFDIYVLYIVLMFLGTFIQRTRRINGRKQRKNQKKSTRRNKSNHKRNNSLSAFSIYSNKY